jgi:hypothetical protein
MSANFLRFIVSFVPVLMLALPATHDDIQLEILKVSVKQ